MQTDSLPWVEKYRPKELSEVVLDKYNKTILENIIERDHFPNLLLYGPPGTGKTTTIINLINSYQKKYNQYHKGLMIHLNASDERGIDIVRNNISNFVNSKNLFNKGTKFIILDEVDYMTKNAQQALKYLLEINNQNVRFCLICNYISRIDESLQNEFMRLRFNQLPSDKIIKFLKEIVIEENLKFTDVELKNIQELFQSDIRSMINYMQSNQYIIKKKNIINNEIWINLIKKLENDINLQVFNNEITNISNKFEIDIKYIIKTFIVFIINNYKINSKFLNEIEILIHQIDNNLNFSICYLYFCLKELI